MEDPKAKSKSVSLQPELWEKVEDAAARHYHGNRSAYIRELATRDLAGLSIGTHQSAFSARQVESWVRAERTLLAAARHALSVLNAETAEARERAGRELATLILQAQLGEPPAEIAQSMVNEESPAPSSSRPTTPPSVHHTPGMTVKNLAQTLTDKPTRVPRK